MLRLGGLYCTGVLRLGGLYWCAEIGWSVQRVVIYGNVNKLRICRRTNSSSTCC